MITIITGSLNSGKTTRLIQHYETHRKGDGFAALKIMEGHQVIGFDALHLSTGEQKRLLTHQNVCSFIPETPMIGPYGLNQKTFAWMIELLNDMIKHQKSPVYIDEIGQWELNHQGFDAIIKKILDHPLDLICVVRDCWLDQVINHYQMSQTRIIT